MRPRFLRGSRDLRPIRNGPLQEVSTPGSVDQLGSSGASFGCLWLALVTFGYLWLPLVTGALRYLGLPQDSVCLDLDQASVSIFVDW